MQLRACGSWCLQRMMESEARGNLKDRKADKAGTSRKRQKPEHDTDYLDQFFAKSRFQTPNKDPQSDATSSETSPSVQDPLSAIALSMSGFADAQKQAALAKQDAAKARLVEAETRQKEVSANAEQSVRMMEMMQSMMQFMQSHK